MYIKKRFEGIIKEKRTISAACKDLLKNYNYTKINKLLQEIESYDYYIIILLPKSCVDEYNEWYKDNEDTKILRQDLAQI